MSLEDEAMEFFSVYHGQREYVQELERKQAVYEQIITELFMLAEPGPVKNALWRRYEQEKLHEPLEGISGI